MVATLYSGFNTARIGSLGGSLSDGAVTDAAVSVTAGRYSHVSIESIMGTGLYTAFAAAVETALLAASPSADYDVSFSTTTRLYTIANAGNAFTLDLTSAAGQRLAKALGVTAANSLADSGTGYSVVIATGSSNDLVSDVLPYYLVPLARDEPAKYSRPFEASGMVHRKVTTNGNAVSVEPLTIPEHIDLSTLFMPLANVFADDAATAQPWTIQHLVRHARAHEPVLFDFVSSGDLVCKLSEQDATFGKEMRAVSFSQAQDFHGLFNVAFSALQYLGRL